MVMGKGKGKLLKGEAGPSKGPGNGPLTLLNLPEEVLEMVVVKASNRSVQNMCSLLCTCQKLKTILELDSFYKSIDLMFMYRPPRSNLELAFYRNLIPPKWLELKLKCYSKHNPSALLLKGMCEFMTGGNPQVGIDDIRKSAEAGFEMGKFCYGVIRKVLWIDGVDSGPVFPITREFCVAHRLSLRRRYGDEWKWDWNQSISKSFSKRWTDIDVSCVKKKKGCICGVHSMSVEEWKWSPAICDRCFWVLEGWNFCWNSQDYFPFWV